MTFFNVTVATHVTARDVIQKDELYNIAAVVERICIYREENRSYLQLDHSARLEDGYPVIFQGFARTCYDIFAGSHGTVTWQCPYGRAENSLVTKSSCGRWAFGNLARQKLIPQANELI